MRVFLAGHNGMVGSSVLNLLKESSGFEVLIANRAELDLTNQDEVKRYFLKMIQNYFDLSWQPLQHRKRQSHHEFQFLFQAV